MLYIEVRKTDSNSTRYISSEHWTVNGGISKNDFYESVKELIARHKGDLESLWCNGEEYAEISKFLKENFTNIPISTTLDRCWWFNDTAKFIFNNYFG